LPTHSVRASTELEFQPVTKSAAATIIGNVQRRQTLINPFFPPKADLCD
jgi:hypothetical protein